MSCTTSFTVSYENRNQIPFTTFFSSTAKYTKHNWKYLPLKYHVRNVICSLVSRDVWEVLLIKLFNIRYRVYLLSVRPLLLIYRWFTDVFQPKSLEIQPNNPPNTTHWLSKQSPLYKASKELFFHTLLLTHSLKK